MVCGKDLQNRRGKMPLFPEPLSRHRMRHRKGVELDFGYVSLGVVGTLCQELMIFLWEEVQ